MLDTCKNRTAHSSDAIVVCIDRSNCDMRAHFILNFFCIVIDQCKTIEGMRSVYWHNYQYSRLHKAGLVTNTTIKYEIHWGIWLQ